MSKQTNLSGDFRKYMNKNYLGSWDVPESDDLVATIKEVQVEDVTNQGGTEEKLTIHFKEPELKPMIINTTNAQAISKVAGSTKVQDWVNHKIAIFKANVSAFGTTTEALRVRDYAPKTKELICADCGQPIQAHDKYSAKVIAERAMTKHGRYLCFDCATEFGAVGGEEA